MNKLIRYMGSFAIEDHGDQVVEYALIIAVVSIGLTIALGGLSNGSFSSFITRVGTCLTSSTCV